MGGDKEVEIEGRVIGENSKVSLTVKTLVWIIVGLFALISTMATIGYFDIKGEQQRMHDEYEKGKKDYKKEIREMLKEELKDFREKDVKFIEDIGEIKGDIKVILDRTIRNNDHNNSGRVNSGNTNNTPEIIPTNNTRDNINGVNG